MRLVKTFLIPILVMLALSGCAATMTDIRGFNLISLDEERQLGNKFALEVEKQHKLYQDDEVNRYLDTVGRRLLSGVREVSFDYRFKAVDDKNVNAFAIPGGRVYINTGLIKAARNESELAAVMAHEINHAVARHGTRQLTQQFGYALVIQLLLGDNPGTLSQLAASLFGQAGMMSYSRDMESQADYLGAETMYRAGYNPEAMISFFSSLESMNKSTPGALSKFFSSHPLTAERIERVRSTIAAFPPRDNFMGDSAEFRRIKARLR